jgi:hypothetical protein
VKDRWWWLALLAGLAAGGLYVALLWLLLVAPYAGRR